MGRKIEVLKDLESTVHAMMVEHEKKRELWMPHDLLSAPIGVDPDEHLKELRARVAGVPDAARAALALNASADMAKVDVRKLQSQLRKDGVYLENVPSFQ